MKTFTTLALAVVLSMGVALAQTDEERREARRRTLLAQVPQEEWTPVAYSIHTEGSDGWLLSVSAKRQPKKVTDNVYRLWLRVDHSPAAAYLDTGKTYTIWMSFTEVECEDISMRHVSSAYYTLTGNVVASFDKEAAEWNVQAPGTKGERMVQAACDHIQK